LPAWARVVGGPLPQTTAKMLEPDHLHREKNPLGPMLAGKLRWAAADAAGSKFGVATAEADLRRAGLGDTDLADLAETAKLPRAERVALAFARKLTRAGYAITDDEFAELLKLHGPEKVTAIVHTVAYANFLDRVVLGLGAAGQPGPPGAGGFDPDRLPRGEGPGPPAGGGPES